MNAKIRVEGQERYVRSVDTNGTPCDRLVPSNDIVVFVGNQIVSSSMRKRLGMEAQHFGSETGVSREPSTRWGLPEDPPGRARLLG
ncbi:MAG TPA: hypothetical protein P5247_02965 [Candidatus Saccharimonadales bacterium]|nr:hypothetical protein [Candidatus Saccharimonadales bacterium]